AAEHRGGQWWIAGHRAPGVALRLGATVSVFGATTVHFTLPDPLARDQDQGAGAGVVLAPMPGLVKAVFVAPGAVVEKGARLAILEAMKMEHTLTAGRDGTVAEVLAAAGQQVEAGAALIALADE
ncbi:MAG: acetyl-CoA carboxylase biotin carboxyl carrier protein subunit, partial [Rhodobacteraceae bacterium]|nr:acetyl-CoA carboxylase biotin carboxyl carrier protein subunit [Paracoccaceae bacterium]